MCVLRLLIRHVFNIGELNLKPLSTIFISDSFVLNGNKMSMFRFCKLICLKNTHEPIPLPHGEEVFVGRSEITRINNSALSRKQVRLVADTELCTVKVTCIGVNPSGVNSFKILPHTDYVLHHRDKLELLLDEYIHEVVFEPAPAESEDAERPSESEDAERLAESEDAERPAKRRRTATQSGGGWAEEAGGKLLVYSSAGLEPRNQIAAYDLDGTLIVTKSGRRFPKDADDWRLQFPQVTERLRALHDSGHKVVVLTNQGGVAAGRLRLDDLRRRVESVVARLGVPVQVLVATGHDVHRKPAPGMWDALAARWNGGIAPDATRSFFCGDAAGRPRAWAPGRARDHSLADRLFALNVGLAFHTPEEHFLGARVAPHAPPAWDPRVLRDAAAPTAPPLPGGRQELVVLVGAPGAGKSTVCARWLAPAGYEVVSRDQLGSWQRCVARLEAVLRAGRSAAVDNTNPDRESRRRYVQVAARLGVPARCFLLDTEPAHARHNNLFRRLTDAAHAPVADIVVNTYHSRVEPPSEDEGFEQVVRVHSAPPPRDAALDRLYHMFLLDK